MNYTEKRRIEVKRILRRFIVRNLQRSKKPEVVNILTELVEKFAKETLYTQDEEKKIQSLLLEVQYGETSIENFNKALTEMEE